jgi:thiamine pyrophosphokinase
VYKRQLIPFTEKVEGLSTKGAHYELTNAAIELGDSYGVSNYFEGNSVEVSIKNGCLLVIKSDD